MRVLHGVFLVFFLLFTGMYCLFILQYGMKCGSLVVKLNDAVVSGRVVSCHALQRFHHFGLRLEEVCGHVSPTTVDPGPGPAEGETKEVHS